MRRTEVRLSPEERAELRALTRSGSSNARKLTRARILLKADAFGEHLSNPEVARILDVNVQTVWRVKKRFCEQGLAAAIEHARAARHKPRKLDGRGEAHLIALACSRPPEGQARWSLRLLADKLVELEVVEAISHEAVRRTLKKTRSPRTSASNG